MSAALKIAGEEWRYWLRSNLALAVIGLFAIILVSVSLLPALRMSAENAARELHQAEAEQTFLSQPDRHPHRMVHYGHYVFRAPVPLALFDPGLDSVTGQSMFLEGHRQNSATFSTSVASANLGSFSWLTPALVYQLLAPLLIILLGHGAIIREREAGALIPLLAQGVNGRTLILGKVLALLAFILLLLLPLIISALLSVAQGESLLAVMSLVGVYFLYLLVWAGLALLVSSSLNKRSSVVATLASFWLVLTLVLPAVAVNNSSNALPIAGKIESELAMLTENHELSDGHNVPDAAFDQLRTNLLIEYGVDRVEDLDVNIRGIVAQTAEETLTDSMNLYAENRMSQELQQANIVTNHGWITPVISIATASRAISGTDLEHYHSFLRQAEIVRYDFVQGLNKVHAEQLSYVVDINRSRDQESERQTRMDASNWQVLNEFRFEASNASERLSNASTSIIMLAVWVLGLCGLLAWVGGRLKP